MYSMLCGLLRLFSRPTLVGIRRVRLEYDGMLYAYVDGSDGRSYAVVDKSFGSVDLLDALQEHSLAFGNFLFLLEHVDESLGRDLATVMATYAVIHKYWLSIGIEVDKCRGRVADVDRMLANMLDIYYRKPARVARMLEEVSNCLLLNGLESRLSGIPAVCSRTMLPDWARRHASIEDL